MAFYAFGLGGHGFRIWKVCPSESTAVCKAKLLTLSSLILRITYRVTSDLDLAVACSHPGMSEDAAQSSGLGQNVRG